MKALEVNQDSQVLMAKILQISPTFCTASSFKETRHKTVRNIQFYLHEMLGKTNLIYAGRMWSGGCQPEYGLAMGRGTKEPSEF